MADTARRDGSILRHLLSSDALWVTLGWYAVALLACLSVLLINGVPLYYFDTGGYLIQGEQFLKIIGLAQDQGAGAGAAGGVDASADDGTVQGNRSLIYGISLSIFQAFGGLSGAVVAQSAILIAMLGLTMRFVLRAYRSDVSVAAATGISVLAACLGSAPFYTAFLMPDIFAPVLILSLAALSAFIGSLRRWEIAACFLLAATSVVMHPSHLLMAILFVPMAPVAAYVSASRRAILSLILAGSVVLVGVVERFVFTFAAESLADSEVIYQPFLTARLIVDGPALIYLEEVCPEAELATCDLIEMFVRPRQITASHIVFEETEELGSFRLLPEATQRRIVQEQKTILLNVIRTRPLGLFRAVGHNVLVQLGLISVKMTLPDEDILENIVRSTPAVTEIFAAAKLTDWARWETRLTLFHYVIYSFSTLVIIGAIFLRRLGAGRDFRVFAGWVLAGILTNALVLGALSQPAARYGARVAFLAPALAAIILLLWARKKYSGPATAESERAA